MFNTATLEERQQPNTAAQEKVPTSRLEQREMIAVGASLAAGCLPCTDYHAQALQQQGASEHEALVAAIIGMAVRREALEIMALRARELFGLSDVPQTISTAELCPVGVSIAIASAAAAHSVPALERFMKAAEELGLGEADVMRAVRIGRKIRETAASKVDQAAQSAATPERTDEAAPCGCGKANAGVSEKGITADTEVPPSGCH